MRSIKFFVSASIIAACTMTVSACGNGNEGEVTSAEPLPKVEAPAGTQWSDTVVKSDENGYVIGNPDAPIKLVEYAALTCGACAAFENEAYRDILENYVADGRVSFEIRNFLLNPYGIALGVLTRCGATQSYPALTEQVFQNQAAILQQAQAVDPTLMQAAFAKPESERYVEMARLMGLFEFFSARGISQDQATSCLADPKMSKELIDMTEKGTKEYKVQGTPSFFINNQKIEYQGWANLKGKIQEAGAR